MDWVALAAVVSGAVVAITGTVVAAAGRRGDRKHAAALDYEQRVWETKSAALITVIGACEKVCAAVQGPRRLGGRFATVEHHADVFEAIYGCDESLTTSAAGDSVAALCDDPVCDALRNVHAAIDPLLRAYDVMQMMVEMQRELLVDVRGHAELAEAASASIETLRTQVGTGMKADAVDLDALDRVYRALIESARRDLRGPVGK